MTTTIETQLPVRRVIRRHQGDTWESFSVTWKQGGSPVDLTGYTAQLALSVNSSATAVHQFSSTDGDISIDAANGQVTLSVPFAKTQAVTPGKYYFDLVVFDATKKRTLLYGDFVVTGNAEAS